MNKKKKSQINYNKKKKTIMNKTKNKKIKLKKKKKTRRRKYEKINYVIKDGMFHLMNKVNIKFSIL